MSDQTLRVAVEQLFDSLTTTPLPAHCRKCGSPMINVEATFFALGGKMWNVALPVCPRCDLKEDSATFVPDMDC